MDYEFEFSAKSTYAIYAPNEMMKTSLTKTFLDLSNGLVSQIQSLKREKLKGK